MTKVDPSFVFTIGVVPAALIVVAIGAIAIAVHFFNRGRCDRD